ncbi:MAG: hypothetical protein E7083_04390 [Bacteroidales bacterium]|nr:hypothetical protein [Bacteroidales bacterium]
MLSINKTYYVIFLLMLLMGLYFNNAFSVFKFTDELLSWSLLGVALVVAFAKNSFSKFNKLWLLVAISVFYLVYSIIVTQYNTTGAVLSDFLVQLKPFIAFFATLALAPKFTLKQKTWLRYICFSLAILMLLLFLMPGDIWEAIYFHPAYLGITATVLALIYYYCSDGDKRSKIITIFILAVGFCGARSKFYGFFVVALFFLFFFKREMLGRIKIKYIVVGIFAVLLMLLVAWQKIDYYFISGGEFSTDEISESVARAALYVYSPEILADHPLFGTGFASYATYYSAHPYSSLYAEYEMNKIWGISEDMNDFIADTYYPVMVQFGYIGLLLYITFICLIYKRIKRGAKRFELSDKNIHVAFLCLMFVLIESIAGAAFVLGGGILSMMLCAIALRDVVNKENSI